MSQSRKKNMRSSKNYNKRSSMNSNSDDVLNKLDGLRSNIKQEQKSISNTSKNNHIKIYAMLIIVIVTGAGLFIIYSPKTISNLSGSSSSASNIQSLTGNFKKDILATPVYVNNKISFVYVGGLFCRDCAMERWAIVMALSQFGNFSGLSFFKSAQDKIPTYNFTKASYTSSIVNFQSVEVYDNTAPPNQKLLQPLTGAPKTYFAKYANHNIPFICIAGSIYQSGPGSSLLLQSFAGQQSSTIQNQINSKSGTLYDQISAESKIIVQVINQVIGYQSSTPSTVSTTNTTG